MMARPLLALVLLTRAAQGQEAEERCLSCHFYDGVLDITGVRALGDLPESWPLLFEDAFDLDGDGIAGQVRFVSGTDLPRVGLWGKALAAGRFEDFARLAAQVHDIPLGDDLSRIAVRFAALSPPPPEHPFERATDRAAFEEAGCASCHVTASSVSQGAQVYPLSDFLLHDLGAGPRRTPPLWSCNADCLPKPTAP